MNYLKYASLLGLAAGILQGATIVSGYEIYSFPSTTSQSGGLFALNLSDGFSFSGGGQYDGAAPSPDQCISFMGDRGCPTPLAPPSGANLNGSGGYFGNIFPFGTLYFTVGRVQPLAGIDNQTFFLPFTATGDVSGPFDSRSPMAFPCALPSATPQNGCYETFTGAGTASITVRYQNLGNGGIVSYWISNATFTFADPSAATPEPSTFLYMGISALLFLMFKHERILRSLGCTARNYNQERLHESIEV